MVFVRQWALISEWVGALLTLTFDEELIYLHKSAWLLEDFVMCLFLNNNISQTDTSVKGKEEHINRSLNGDQILMRMKPYLRMQELAFPAANSFHKPKKREKRFIKIIKKLGDPLG